MADNGLYTGGSSIQEASLKAKAMDLESGLLGRFFGGSNTAPSNIAGLILVSLIVAGIYLQVFQPTSATEFWKISSPLITLVFGFISGNKK